MPVQSEFGRIKTNPFWTSSQDDARVIAVDWSRGCALPNYIQAVANTQLVGRQIAVVLHKLMEISPDNVSPGTTHYIGHSLGAQMAKFFSEYFRNLSGNLLIGRITGERTAIESSVLRISILTDDNWLQLYHRIFQLWTLPHLYSKFKMSV